MKLTEPDLSAQAPQWYAAGVDDGSPLAAEGLVESLSRIVSDPGRIKALHELLGPLCHQSRNILNSLKLSLYLARRQETPGASGAGHWDPLEAQYRAVEGFYDRLQFIVRPITLAVVPMSLSLLMEDRRDAWLANFAAHGRVLRMSAGARTDTGEYDPHILGQALDTFVAWRAWVGEKGREARLQWWTGEGKFHLEWVEPQAPAKTRTAKATGSRARVRSEDGAGAGADLSEPPSLDLPEPLALPLVGRVISAHGGVMELLDPADCHVRLTWPQHHVACRPN